jgi:hypothetical protein
MTRLTIRMLQLLPVFIVVLLVGLPLLGVWLAGEAIAPYLEFPPRTRNIDQTAFSWPVFLGLALAVLAVITPFVARISRCAAPAYLPQIHARSFPWWGWVGLGWTICAWVLAWTRLDWMGPFQTYSFTPLWMGYIVVMNAWTWSRRGHSPLIVRPARFAALFPLSAVLWWFFEYLNRFVDNWYYAGAGELTQWAYIVQATIPFSTVLPAVISTRHWLGTFPRLSCGLDRCPPFEVAHPRPWAIAVLLLSAAGLLGLGIWPTLLFPLVWLAPLVVVVSLQVILGQPTIFAPVSQGDWRLIWTAALASLICGVFWELWNWHSLAHWRYAIPYVDRFHIFAMPLLGYAGYLPFGLECAVIADLVLKDHVPVVRDAALEPPIVA